MELENIDIGINPNYEIDPNFDQNFEPIRSRAYTWHGRPKDIAEEGNLTPTSVLSENDNTEHESPENLQDSEDVATNELVEQTQKKGGSRRNAWGNLSYADLITKAIQSTPDQRLTLSQIYDWMVQNVPYFKDKGDSNSSAGWKNSIRHNLSLHSRFQRIQNEGTGKSSWWIVNPDAKSTKAPRRRVASMDTKGMKDKRTRVKRRVDQLRALEQCKLDGPFSGSSGELGDQFNLSPGDYRARAGSNASSISIGRSPPSGYDYDGCQKLSISPGAWEDLSEYTNRVNYPDTIAESFAELLVGTDALNQPFGDGVVSATRMVSPNAIQPHSSPPNYNNQQTFLQQLGNFSEAFPPNTSVSLHNGSSAISYPSSHLVQQHQRQLTQHQRAPMPPQRHLASQTLSQLLEQVDPIYDSDMRMPEATIKVPQYNNYGQAAPQVQGSTTKANGVNGLPMIKQEPTCNPAAGGGPAKADDKGSMLRSLTPEQRNILTTSLLRQVLTDQLQLQQQLQLGLPGSAKPPAAQQPVTKQLVGDVKTSVQSSLLPSYQQALSTSTLKQGFNNTGNYQNSASTAAANPTEGASAAMEVEYDTGCVPFDLQNLDFSNMPDLKTENLEYDLSQILDINLADALDFNFDVQTGTQSNDFPNSNMFKDSYH